MTGASGFFYKNKEMSNDNIKIDFKKPSSDMQAKHGSLTAWMPIINLPKKQQPWQQTYFVVDCSHHCSHGVYAD